MAILVPDKLDKVQIIPNSADVYKKISAEITSALTKLGLQDYSGEAISKVLSEYKKSIEKVQGDKVDKDFAGEGEKILKTFSLQQDPSSGKVTLSLTFVSPETKATETTTLSFEAGGTEITGKIETLEADVKDIKDKIPEQASSENQLADKGFVNSSLEQTAAKRVTSDYSGNPFATRAALMAAETFYHAGKPYTPKEHDYALVSADEGASDPFTNGQTRFEYNGHTWEFAYGINDRPFTYAERQALESGVTLEVINQLKEKYKKPEDGIPKTDLAQAIQDSLDLADNAVQKDGSKVLSENDFTNDLKTSLTETIPSQISDLETKKANTTALESLKEEILGGATEDGNTLKKLEDKLETLDGKVTTDGATLENHTQKLSSLETQQGTNTKDITKLRSDLSTETETRISEDAAIRQSILDLQLGEGDTGEAIKELIEKQLANKADKIELTEGLAKKVDDSQYQTDKAAQEKKLEGQDTKISGIDGRVKTVEGLLTPEAEGKQLADHDFVNSSLAQNMAHRLTADEEGNGFANKAALDEASTFYYQGVAFPPTEHDYTIVLADETAPAPFTGGETRYEYDGSRWVYAYGINNRPFTSAENQALSSGVTKEVVSKANTAYQKPEEGIPTSDLDKSTQQALTKANSALQSESDPTVPDWAKEQNKPTYTKTEVGLGRVDNTSDDEKPISAAQKLEFAKKVNIKEGWDLSENNFSDDDVSKLSGIEENAQANKIEIIKVAGVQKVPGEEKEVDITLADLNGQEKLISGTNIKSINGQSLLGEGDLDLAGKDTVVTLADEQIISGKKTFSSEEGLWVKAQSHEASEEYEKVATVDQLEKLSSSVEKNFIGKDDTLDATKLTGEIPQLSIPSTLEEKNITGNAATATKLQESVQIGGVDFDGSQSIDLPGVNQEGNQDTTGNAATATKLKTPVNIGGVEFDGSGDIDLPGVNQEGNQDTTGNAATATKLKTQVNIGGVEFDGSKSIDLPGVNKTGNQNTTGSAAKLTTPRSLKVDLAGAEEATFDGSAGVENIPVTGKLPLDKLAQGAGASSTQRKVLGTGKSTSAGDLSLVALDKADVGLSNVDNVKQATKTEFDELKGRVDSLEALGVLVGVYDDVESLPDTKSEIEGKTITVNDFATVRSDPSHNNLPVCYTVTKIDGSSGALTWSYEFTYSSDVSGKIDKVLSATDYLPIFTSDGGLKSSGKKITDFASTAEATSEKAGLVKLGNDTPQTGSNKVYPVQKNSDGKMVVAVPWENTVTPTYTLPAAKTTVLGGIKLGDDTVQSVAVAKPSIAAGKTYPVQVDSDGKAVVNVPWDNTVFSPKTLTVKFGGTPDTAQKTYNATADTTLTLGTFAQKNLPANSQATAQYLMLDNKGNISCGGANPVADRISTSRSTNNSSDNKGIGKLIKTEDFSGIFQPYVVAVGKDTTSTLPTGLTAIFGSSIPRKVWTTSTSTGDGAKQVEIKQIDHGIASTKYDGGTAGWVLRVRVLRYEEVTEDSNTHAIKLTELSGAANVSLTTGKVTIYSNTDLINCLVIISPVI